MEITLNINGLIFLKLFMPETLAKPTNWRTWPGTLPHLLSQIKHGLSEQGSNIPYTGHVFLSDDNLSILNNELQQNTTESITLAPIALTPVQKTYCFGICYVSKVGKNFTSPICWRMDRRWRRPRYNHCAKTWNSRSFKPVKLSPI